MNTGGLLPLDTPEEPEATPLYVSQRWGGTSLLLGKINAEDQKRETAYAETVT